MSNTSPLLHDLKDDDIVLLFRMPSDGTRRKPVRVQWQTLKQAVLEQQPTVRGDVGPQGPQGIPGKDGASITGPKGDTGAPGKDGVSITGPQGVPGKDGLSIVGPTGPRGETGGIGLTGATGQTGATGPAGRDGAGLRIEEFSGTTNASGIAAITFSPAYTNVPKIKIVEGWINDQMISGAVVAGSATKTGCNVLVKVSRATLLLSAGPFQTAGANVSITVQAAGL